MCQNLKKPFINTVNIVIIILQDCSHTQQENNSDQNHLNYHYRSPKSTVICLRILRYYGNIIITKVRDIL